MRASEGSEPAKADCEDPIIKAACLLDSKDSEKEDTVVKSGDLAVSAKAADGRKALIGWVSDLDTITFKTSEDVTISSITLERYGYSTKEQVKSVQLEDEDGNIIADAKEINSKGQVKLTLKKDYKTVDGTFKATVVVTTNNLPTEEYPTATNGSTLGFKVIAAESTAKNLNLDDYSPYTYDLVSYKGSAVQFSSRNSARKDYNFEAGKLYEIAKFRVKSPSDAAILVKGFTLTDKGTTNNAIDADKFAKDVTVTFNGKEVSGLKWKFNKDEELVVSFNEVEIAGKETATIVVNMSFTEEFDNFGESSNFYISDLSNFNAIDKKTETRVSQDETKDQGVELYTIAALKAKMTTYYFNGGKVKISGSKLGTVNAAAGATNVKIAEWEITISEALRGSAWIKAKTLEDAAKIDEIRLVINGEEYDGSKGADKMTYTFKGLEIEKSGKVEVRVDVKSDTEGNIEFDGSLNSASFVTQNAQGQDVSTLKYDESGEDVSADQIAGSLSISSIKIQAAKANLTNKTTTKAELVIGDNNRKTIFDGTYEAKKGDVTLKNFVITATTADGEIDFAPAPTFYVTVNGEEYDAKWNTDNCKINNKTVDCAKWDIDDIKVADGKSINVKVEIEVVPTIGEYADDEAEAAAIKLMYNTFNLALEWEDEDNNPAGQADEDTVRVEVVKQGTINVTDTSSKKTVLLKSDRTVAEFKIKPSKSSDDDIILNTMELTWKVDKDHPITAPAEGTIWDELKFDIDGDTSYKTADGKFSNLGISIPASWVIVKISLKSELDTAKRYLKIDTINGKSINSEFSKYYVPAIVKVTQNNGKGKDTTTYTATVDNDSSDDVKNLKLYVDKTAANGYCPTAADVDDTLCEAAHKDTLSEGSVEDNKFSATNDDKAHTITAISYVVGDGDPIVIYKSEFENFFEKAYSDDDLMVYSNKS